MTATQTNQATPEKPKQNKNFLPLIILLLVLIVGGAGLAWYSKHKTSNGTSSSSAVGWSEYTNNKYGFKFDYPKKWGMPTVTESPGTTGKTYTVSIQQAGSQNLANSSPVISVNFDSQDFSSKGCDAIDPTSCNVTQSFTSSSVKQAITMYKSSYATYTADSTGLVTQGPGPGQQTLQVQEVVSLPALKVTAARANYILSNTPKSCAIAKFSSENSSGCIKKSDYETMTKFLDSFQSY